MKTLKHFIRITLVLSIAFLSLQSFIGYDDGSETTPGTIEFIGEAGSPNTFIFRKWEFTKAEVPNGDFEKVMVEVDINTSSMQTKWKDLEKSLKKKKDYFYVKKFPSAVIKINGAKKQADGSYITQAALTLKGKTNMVPLTFTVDGNNQIKGKGMLNRRDFKFTGDGPKDEVPITFDVTLPIE